MKTYFVNQSNDEFLYSGIKYKSKSKVEISDELAKEMRQHRNIKQKMSNGLFFISTLKDNYLIEVEVDVSPPKLILNPPKFHSIKASG